MLNAESFVLIKKCAYSVNIIKVFSPDHKDFVRPKLSKVRDTATGFASNYSLVDLDKVQAHKMSIVVSHKLYILSEFHNTQAGENDRVTTY